MALFLEHYSYFCPGGDGKRLYIRRFVECCSIIIMRRYWALHLHLVLMSSYSVHAALLTYYS